MNKNVLQILSGADVEGIVALIAKLEQSPFDYLKLEGDGVKIVIGKNGVTETTEPSAAAAGKAAAAHGPASATLGLDGSVAQAGIMGETATAAAETVAPPGAGFTASVEERPGVFVIKSPSYGLFYAQPEPGAPPYIKIGDTVRKGDTIGLLEIMKTFNAVTSEVDGEVTAIHAKNEQLLEPDMPLVSIKLR
ncbi:MAG: hypothetical protein FWG28_05370 [Clostridiales bacterium]|nr:hypothetical protein [Clostridiales bacterium]